MPAARSAHHAQSRISPDWGLIIITQTGTLVGTPQHYQITLVPPIIPRPHFLHPMRTLYSLSLLSLAYLFHRAAIKSRGKGSWATDQWLLRAQGAFLIASLLIWFL
jgi:hypothetical protein